MIIMLIYFTLLRVASSIDESQWSSQDDALACVPEAMLNYAETGKLRIAAQGGSASACSRERVGCWPYLLEEKLSHASESVLFPAKRTANITVSNASHGSTNSLWATLLRDSLLEGDYDIYVWEYGINDPGVTGFFRRDVLIYLAETFARSVLEKNPRAYLIFAILWRHPNANDTKFNLISESIVKELVAKLRAAGAAADYVSLGHLANDLSTFKELLIDSHHPSQLGHWIFAGLIADLITARYGDNRSRLATCTFDKSAFKLAALPQGCGDSFSRELLEIIQTQPANWKAILCEKPTVKPCHNTIITDKHIEWREDYHSVIPLGRCGKVESAVLPLNNTGERTRLINVFGRKLGSIGPYKLPTVSNVTRRGKPVSFTVRDISMKCFLTSFMNFFQRWIVLDEEIDDITIHLCAPQFANTSFSHVIWHTSTRTRYNWW